MRKPLAPSWFRANHTLGLSPHTCPSLSPPHHVSSSGFRRTCSLWSYLTMLTMQGTLVNLQTLKMMKKKRKEKEKEQALKTSFFFFFPFLWETPEAAVNTSPPLETRRGNRECAKANNARLFTVYSQCQSSAFRLLPWRHPRRWP